MISYKNTSIASLFEVQLRQTETHLNLDVCKQQHLCILLSFCLNTDMNERPTEKSNIISVSLKVLNQIIFHAACLKNSHVF